MLFSPERPQALRRLTPLPGPGLITQDRSQKELTKLIGDEMRSPGDRHQHLESRTLGGNTGVTDFFLVNRGEGFVYSILAISRSAQAYEINSPVFVSNHAGSLWAAS